jgi:hypothetical protein
MFVHKPADGMKVGSGFWFLDGSESPESSLLSFYKVKMLYR